MGVSFVSLFRSGVSCRFWVYVLGAALDLIKSPGPGLSLCLGLDQVLIWFSISRGVLTIYSRLYDVWKCVCLLPSSVASWQFEALVSVLAVNTWSKLLVVGDATHFTGPLERMPEARCIVR